MVSGELAIVAAACKAVERAPVVHSIRDAHLPQVVAAGADGRDYLPEFELTIEQMVDRLPLGRRDALAGNGPIVLSAPAVGDARAGAETLDTGRDGGIARLPAPAGSAPDLGLPDFEALKSMKLGRS